MPQEWPTVLSRELLNMTKKKLTHTGTLVGHDSRTPENYRGTVQLRATKNFWVTATGVKYSKRDGYPSGSGWPMFHLDPESVRPLDD